MEAPASVQSQGVALDSDHQDSVLHTDRVGHCRMGPARRFWCSLVQRRGAGGAAVCVARQWRGQARARTLAAASGNRAELSWAAAAASGHHRGLAVPDPARARFFVDGRVHEHGRVAPEQVQRRLAVLRWRKGGGGDDNRDERRVQGAGLRAGQHLFGAPFDERACAAAASQRHGAAELDRANGPG